MWSSHSFLIVIFSSMIGCASAVVARPAPVVTDDGRCGWCATAPELIKDAAITAITLICVFMTLPPGFGAHGRSGPCRAIGCELGGKVPRSWWRENREPFVLIRIGLTPKAVWAGTAVPMRDRAGTQTSHNRLGRAGDRVRYFDQSHLMR